MLGDIKREAFVAFHPVTEIADPASAIAARLSVLGNGPVPSCARTGKAKDAITPAATVILAISLCKRASMYLVLSHRLSFADQIPSVACVSSTAQA
jgi:hypothetical protein